MADDENALYIDGVAYTFDDLTFREQRKLREFVRELAPDTGDIDDAAEPDFVPAFIAVIKQRDDESFQLDQALDFKLADLVKPEPKKRPSRGSTKAS